ncbi:MAG: CPBP family intramembrane metalloprotease [Deltaproteobacteria bacterium]|nr:MAG: CPBP family intramembrane metalloprotease [Deltaproteobacteria bacterium]
MSDDLPPWQAAISPRLQERKAIPGTGHWPDERPWISSRLSALAVAALLLTLAPVFLLCLGGAAAAVGLLLQSPEVLSDPASLETALSAEVLFLSFFVGFGSWTLACGVTVFVVGWRPKHGFALRRPSLTMLGIALIGGLFVGLFPGWIAHQIVETFPDLANQGALEAIDRVLNSGGPFSRTLTLITIVIGAPIFEELCFRGALWNALERLAPGIFGQSIALIVTSLAFVVAHADLVQSPALVLTAFFLGWLRLTSGSIWPCILAHFVNNSLAATVGILASQTEFDDIEPALWIALLGLGVTIVLVALAYVLRREPLATPEQAWAELPEGLARGS